LMVSEARSDEIGMTTWQKEKSSTHMRIRRAKTRRVFKDDGMKFVAADSKSGAEQYCPLPLFFSYLFESIGLDFHL